MPFFKTHKYLNLFDDQDLRRYNNYKNAVLMAMNGDSDKELEKAFLKLEWYKQGYSYFPERKSTNA